MTKNEVAALFLGFAFGLLFTIFLSVMFFLPEEINNFRKEAVQKGFGEFTTDGNKIEFKWKN